MVKWRTFHCSRGWCTKINHMAMFWPHLPSYKGLSYFHSVPDKSDKRSLQTLVFTVTVIKPGIMPNRFLLHHLSQTLLYKYGFVTS